MKLTRPRNGRMVAGVCAGVAQHFGWDPGAVRVVTVVATLFFGSALIVYLALWYLMPSADV